MWSRRIDVSGSALRGSDAAGDGPEGFGFTDRPIPGNAPLAVFNGITSGWIATFGTPLLAGRDLSERDGPGSPRVALVNQAFARKFLEGANPVGHTIQPTKEPGSPPIEIVGLVADAVYRDVREPTLPTVYVPLSQSIDRSLVEDPTMMSAPAIVTLSIRAASGQPGLLTKSVAAAIGEINPTLALTFEPLDNRIRDALTRERLLAILSASFGLLALVMAAVGLYGVTSYAVSLRQTEIGIRMALGATRGSVIRLVLGPRVAPGRRRHCRGAGDRGVGVAFRGHAALRSRAGRSGHTRRVGSDIGADRCGCWLASGAPRLPSRPDSDPARCVRSRGRHVHPFTSRRDGKLVGRRWSI